MNKIFLTILVSVLIVIGATYLFFSKYFLIENWKIIPRADYDSIILSDELSKSAQEGNIEKQLQVAEELVKVRRNDNQAKITLANVYLEKASLEFKEEEYGNKAMALANEVLTNDPENAQAYLTLGYSYEVLQDYQKALENYNKALVIVPNSDIAYVKRGHAYDLAGDLESAEADYSKAYELNKENDTALMNLSRIAQRKGDWENARNYANIVVQVSKIAYVKATAYEIIGLADLEVDKYSDAVQSFTNSINTYGNYGNAYPNRAYAKILLSNYVIKDNILKSEIEADLNRALEIYNKDAFAYVVHALLMEGVNDKAKALEYYQTALGLVDQDITLGVAEKGVMKEKINQSIVNLNNN